MRKKKEGSYLDILRKDVYDSIPPSFLAGPWNYEKLQMLADVYLDCPVQDLCGLDTENDPFYCGAEGHRAKAEWIAGHWSDIMRGRDKISIRSTHYWLASKGIPFPKGYKGQKGKPHHMNDDGCVGLCNISMKYVRYLGKVSYDQIVDEKTSEPNDNPGWKYRWRAVGASLSLEVVSPELPDADLPNLTFPDLPSFEIQDFHVPQTYHLEIWCEKSTMNHILEPLAKQYNAVYQDLSGESSATCVREAVKRLIVDGRPARIFYISDYDPAGENMPRAMSVKLFHGLSEKSSDLDVRVYHIGLTEEQVNKHNLERIPLKESETRGKRFEERHNNTGGVELDSLEATQPGLLKIFTKEWLDRYYDHDLDERLDSAHDDLSGELEGICEELLSPLQDEIDEFKEEWEKTCKEVEDLLKPLFEKRDRFWKEMEDKLNAHEVEYTKKDMPQPEYEDEGEFDIPLFDSMRGYLVQNLFFQAQKRNIPFEDVRRQIEQSGIADFLVLAEREKEEEDYE